MPGASTARRVGRPRRTAAAAIRATQPCCWLCDLPVDLTLHRGPANPHPLSSVIDEIIPVKRGGSITDPTNLRHAHRICNGSRGIKPMVEWDPGWNPTTCHPEEVRARCRHLANALLEAPHNVTLSPW